MQTPEARNKKKKQIVFYNRNRSSVRITVLLFFLVHLGFYLTGFISDRGKYTYSEFRVPQSLSQYKAVSLIRWDYAPSDRTMELAFDITDTAYSEGTIEFAALFDNSKVLDSQIVYNEQGMLIIQLYRIPSQTGKKVTVTFEYTPEGEKTSEISFSSYTGIIDEFDTLPILSRDEYYLGRQDYDIEYYQNLIAGLEESISKNETFLANIRQDIIRLQNNTEKLTTDELLNLNETIQNNKSTIEILEGQNEDYKINISSYQEIINVLMERKADYESKNREN